MKLKPSRPPTSPLHLSLALWQLTKTSCIWTSVSESASGTHQERNHGNRTNLHSSFRPTRQTSPTTARCTPRTTPSKPSRPWWQARRGARPTRGACTAPPRVTRGALCLTRELQEDLDHLHSTHVSTSTRCTHPDRAGLAEKRDCQSLILPLQKRALVSVCHRENSEVDIQAQKCINSKL